jgi:sRNA-binding regulator protein Hfq
VNRKLIRTTLAEIKGKNRDGAQLKERPSVVVKRGGGSAGAGGSDRSDRSDRSDHSPRKQSPPPPPPQASSVQVRKRTPPPTETNAELFYYKKQIDAHTLMVIVLQNGEEIEGTIEWYDRSALKVNRKGAPNLMILKHNIKYMFKEEEREGD